MSSWTGKAFPHNFAQPHRLALATPQCKIEHTPRPGGPWRGATNGTLSVNGTDVAVKGLAALAYKAQVSESDLDAALTAVLLAQ